MSCILGSENKISSGTVVGTYYRFITPNEPATDEGTSGHGSDATEALTSAFTDALNEVGSLTVIEQQPPPLPVPIGPPPLGSIMQLVKETGKSRKDCKAALMACENDYASARQQLLPGCEAEETPRDTGSLSCVKRGDAAPYLVQLDCSPDSPSRAPGASLVSVAVDDDNHCRALGPDDEDEDAALLSKVARGQLGPGDLVDQDLWNSFVPDARGNDARGRARILATRSGLRLARVLLQICLRDADEKLRCLHEKLRCAHRALDPPEGGMLFAQVLACADGFDFTPLAGAMRTSNP